MKIINFFIIFTIVTNSVLSQNKTRIYLDQNNNPITNFVFENKLKCKIFQNQLHFKDSLIINKLEYRYEFDSIPQQQKQHFKHLLKSYFNHIDTNQTTVIAYIDSIQGFQELKNSLTTKIIIDQAFIKNYKEYKLSRNKYDKLQKKCQKYSKKNKINTLYTYSYNNNFTFKIKHHKKQILPLSLKNTLFKNKTNGFVILKPNGHFFYYKYLTEEMLTLLIHQNWDNYIADLSHARINPLLNKINFIDKMYKERREKLKNQAILITREKVANNNLQFNTKYKIVLEPTCFSNVNF